MCVSIILRSVLWPEESRLTTTSAALYGISSTQLTISTEPRLPPAGSRGKACHAFSCHLLMTKSDPGDPPYSVAALDLRFSAFSSSRARMDIGLGHAFRNSGRAPKPQSARASTTARLRNAKICRARFYVYTTQAPVSCTGCSLLCCLPNERYASVSVHAPTRSRLSHDCSARWRRYPRATQRLVPIPVSFVVHSFTSFFYPSPLPPISCSC